MADDKSGAPMNDSERNELMSMITQLQNDKEAIKSEYSNKTDDEASVGFREELNTRAGDIKDSIINLALFGTSEATRLKASIWCAEVLLGIKAPATTDDDQFKKLLKDLQGERTTAD